MKTKDELFAFQDIAILLQYLFIDDNNYIEIENCMGIKLRISMNENMDYYCKNMNFPDLPDMYWSSKMTNKVMISIIGQLKKQPPDEKYNTFKNKWEEIKSITLSNLWLNKEN